jgi:hypothetical protein
VPRQPAGAKNKGEVIMSTFVHGDRPAGIARADRTARSNRDTRWTFDGARAGASLLLAAIVAALVVVANQVVDTWTEGHLLVAWVVMWTVVFAAMALFAAPAKRAADGARASLAGWTARRRQAAQDAQYWHAAQHDARIMADISRAMSQAALQEVKAY